MTQKVVMRHEIKLLITYEEYLYLKGILGVLMKRDKNTSNADGYLIRSLYFDDMYNTAYTEKLNGVSSRNKYRVRIYNNSDSIIKLEKKIKLGSRITKNSVTISRDCAESMIKGDFSSLLNIDDDLCREVYTLSKTRLLKPVVVVDYLREAYVYPLSNVRLTFDKNLSAGINDKNIFNKDLVIAPIFKDRHIIFEIKYDDYLPKHIWEVIQRVKGYKIALSKYTLCREKLTEVTIHG